MERPVMKKKISYEFFWTIMVFLLSFCTALFFLGAMLLYDKHVEERRRNDAFLETLGYLLSIPSNLGGRITR